MGHVATAQAPSDLDCPADHVSAYRWGHHLATEPTFHGCGRVVVYHCMKTVGHDDAACAPVWVGRDES